MPMQTSECAKDLPIAVHIADPDPFASWALMARMTEKGPMPPIVDYRVLGGCRQQVPAAFGFHAKACIEVSARRAASQDSTLSDTDRRTVYDNGETFASRRSVTAVSVVAEALFQTLCITNVYAQLCLPTAAGLAR